VKELLLFGPFSERFVGARRDVFVVSSSCFDWTTQRELLVGEEMGE